ncbi:MAG: hypothetical protein LUD68_01270 [Rikenellaceae bacterium]|nr:hypothetical protein [Rikenellaceae bacterium]
MLILIGLLSFFIFIVPVWYKYALTLGVIAAGAGLAVIGALAALTGKTPDIPLFANYYSPVFRFAFPQMDRLSAVFAAIVSLTTFSITLYARDDLKRVTAHFSAVQLSVQFFALSVMFYSMLGVTLFRGGFAFLTAWELMTIASFVLILSRGESGKSGVRRSITSS